jgi:hypothetical protein
VLTPSDQRNRMAGLGQQCREKTSDSARSEYSKLRIAHD